MKQLTLFKESTRLEFGGSLLKGKRKAARPLAFKKPIHFVLKAQNPWLLLKKRLDVDIAIHQMSKRFGLIVYSHVVNADHIHMVIRLPSRELYRKWIRALTSLLVRVVSGLRFKLRPYSRIVSWGKQFKSVLQYLKYNLQEAGFILSAWQWAKHFKGVKIGFPPL